MVRVEELEALRLIELEGLTQEETARRMGVSRPTVGRILAAARHAVTKALVSGGGITIAGGFYRYARGGELTCPRCRRRQPIVPSVRRTVWCRRCCHPVQAYMDSPKNKQQRGPFMDLKNVKIAIASDDGQSVSSHFGRAPYYVVLAIKDGQEVGRERREKFAPHGPGEKEHGHTDEGGEHHGAHSARHAAMLNPIRDCQVVIARGMGDGAYIHMTEAGMAVVLTPLHAIDEISAAARSGELQHQSQRLHQHGQAH